MKKYKQGVFTPIYREKYIGSIPIIYRSLLELKVFRWIDNNKNIIKWGSESVIIPYKSPVDNKMHRYFVDLNVVLLNNNIHEKYLIEIKPHAQTTAPVFSKKKKNSTMLYESATYSINKAKWDAANEWCKRHNYRFLIFTEKHINK